MATSVDAQLRFHFVRIQMLIFVITLGICIWQLVTGGGVGWVGPLLPHVGLWGFFIWIMRPSVGRTSSSLPGLLAVAAAGVVLSSLGGPAAWALASFGLLIDVLYVFWYSKLPVTSTTIAVGKPLPDFTVAEADGTAVPSSSLAHPAVLLFHRGIWCPLCSSQVRELAERYQQVADLGASVVLISPQSADNTRKLAAQYDVPMRFLMDPGAAAARTLGLFHAQGVPSAVPDWDERDTVLPTVVITDADGTVQWMDRTDNYRIRPEPDVFLAVLRGDPVPA